MINLCASSSFPDTFLLSGEENLDFLWLQWHVCIIYNVESHLQTKTSPATRFYRIVTVNKNFVSVFSLEFRVIYMKSYVVTGIMYISLLFYMVRYS